MEVLALIIVFPSDQSSRSPCSVPVPTMSSWVDFNVVVRRWCTIPCLRRLPPLTLVRRTDGPDWDEVIDDWTASVNRDTE